MVKGPKSSVDTPRVGSGLGGSNVRGRSAGTARAQRPSLRARALASLAVAALTAPPFLLVAAPHAWAEPPAPTVTATSPASPANANTPRVIGSAAAGTT